MSEYVIQGKTLTDIANAIRTKSSTQEQYRPDQMAAAIEAIPSGGTEMEDQLVERPRTFVEYTNDRVTKIGAYAFHRSRIQKFLFPNVESIDTGAFSNSSALEKILFPKVTGTLSSVFNACPNLKIVGFGARVIVGGSSCFSYSNLMNMVIFSSDTICTLSNVNAFTRTQIEEGTGYIYVPKALVAEYKTATNWAVYANQFRAIEDYPQVQALVEEMMAV